MMSSRGAGARAGREQPDDPARAPLGERRPAHQRGVERGDGATCELAREQRHAVGHDDHAVGAEEPQQGEQHGGLERARSGAQRERGEDGGEIAGVGGGEQHRHGHGEAARAVPAPHDHQGADHGAGEADAEQGPAAAHFSPGSAMRYPTPRSLKIHVGFAAFSPSFLRRVLTNMRTRLASSPLRGPQTRRSSVS